jgi:protein associated with RNAse G/E
MTDHKGAWNTTLMKPGDRVQVRAYKSDGTCYRWWTATVESAAPDELVLVIPAGHPIEDPGGSFVSGDALRSYYWPGKWYSLLEAYAPDGELCEIYVNISSPVEIDGLQMRFTDYELDVSRRPPGEAELMDEDEFQEAAIEYGYSDEFQRLCCQAAREALDLANRWVPRGIPTSGANEGSA